MKSDFNPDCFSNNLKKLIKLNKIKNTDLAKYLGLSKSAISNYISGISVPKLEIAAKIASFFDVDVEYLISKIVDAGTTLHEDDSPSYKIPVFHKTLISDTIIYKNLNYIGIISSPLPISSDGDCYAVKIYDDSMNGFGFVSGSMAFFSPEDEVFSGDVAAVLVKSKKQIFIRSVKFDKKKITLISDELCEEFKIEKSSCDAQILGKVVYATFNPNEKSTD